MVEKSFLVQKFPKLKLGQFHIIGYSVAGEESVIQIPELDVCFDIGRAPWFSLTSNIICLTHGHMDHIAGLAYYLSQRHFQGMKPGTVLVPRELARDIDTMLLRWREVERQGTPYHLIPMSPGDTHVVRRDFLIRALETHHGGVSLGYSLVNVREKLLPEYSTLTGPQIAALRKSGVNVQYRIEVPLAVYLGDTSFGPVFQHPDVINAQVLLTECTFFEQAHRQRAKAGKHLHVDQLAQILPTLKNQHIIVTHVSRRISIRRARNVLRKLVGDERMANVLFLMDLEDAVEAGTVEDAGPPPGETAE